MSTCLSDSVGSCSRIGSAIWAPMRCTGLSEWSAPWNTIEAPAHRTARSAPHFMVCTSSPSNSTRPVTFAEGGCSRRIVAASVDLPQPDSPATPTTSPAATDSETPRTAGTSPPESR